VKRNERQRRQQSAATVRDPACKRKEPSKIPQRTRESG
jgi:hypothetical protein